MQEKGFSLFMCCCSLCVQYAAGMAGASQTIIIRTALSYQDVYEVCYMNALHHRSDPAGGVALSAVLLM